ncbi:MAG: hypothetical protein EXQ81_08500 [Thermoleophilia bacterium]|nr:hypothetical protein [Thermoleophilia bacterium]
MYRPHSLSRGLLLARRSRVALGLVLCCATAVTFATAATAANRQSVAVIVVPTFDPAAYARRGAVGLLVPGAGATVSRERALASLVSGRVVSSLVGLDGSPTLQLADTPAATTIYVALPPPGSHNNVVRYPVAIVGPGYRGLLTSRSTRIDGLVSLADIAPTAAAIAGGTTPRIRARPDLQAAATLARLDTDLARAHDARTGATLVLIGWLVVFSSLGIVAGSALAGRAAVLVAPVALTAAILLRAVGTDDPSIVVLVLALAVGAGSFLLALRPGALVPVVVVFLGAFLLILTARPEINALAAIGPHPDGGGRFYGITNEVETLLLAPSLAAATLAGVAGAVAIGVLLLATVGWSQTGADGGGLLVVAAAFSVLLAGMTRTRLTPVRTVSGVLCIAALALAIVGLDAHLGGSSHVTDAVGGGPETLIDDLDRRVRISWAWVTSTRITAILCVLSLGALGWLGSRGRHRPVIVAALVAVGVSLVVNDTPVDVLGYGALGCLALTAWEETRASGLHEAGSSWSRRWHERGVWSPRG